MMAMRHVTKQCPRCSSVFICHSGSILACQCSKISLSDAQREYCARQYTDCLCADCLQLLAREQVLLQHGGNDN